MATTSPDNIRTPNPGDSYNLVADLATMASDVQAALIARGNVFKGTTAERTAFLSTAVAGMLWQDTDGIKMIWRKDGSVWVPAVWRWSGTTTQMNAFTQAPNGFEWFNTTDSISYTRLGGAWNKGDTGWERADTLGIGTLNTGWSHRVGAPYDGLQARVKDGVLYLSGSLQKSSTILANDVMFNFAPAYRPAAPVVSYTWTAQSGFTVANADGTWLQAFAGGTNAYVGAQFPLGA